MVFLVTSKCLISDHFRFLLRHFQFVIRHETELRSNNKPQYSSVACGHDFYWTDARTEHQFTGFSSLPPSVSYQTISASFYVTSSSLFDTKLSYEAITTHSTHLLHVVSNINLRKTEIVCLVWYNLLKEINVCESMTGRGWW